MFSTEEVHTKKRVIRHRKVLVFNLNNIDDHTYFIIIELFLVFFFHSYFRCVVYEIHHRTVHIWVNPLKWLEKQKKKQNSRISKSDFVARRNCERVNI